MKQIYLLLFLMAFALAGHSQVQTNVLKDIDPATFIPYFDPIQIPSSIILPKVNVKAEQALHTSSGRTASQYGAVIPVDLTVRDGVLEKKGGLVIWRVCLQSYNAVSLNLHLADLRLPEGSEMYIYNREGSMVSGPVMRQHVYDGVYATDIIEGEEIVVAVIMEERLFESFHLRISTAILGFKRPELDTRAYGDSQSCNVDVRCPAGSGWVNERDAVALIFNALGENCSGALINNGCQNLKSYFLTAQHCLSGDQATLVFRFNYDSPDPVAPTCRGSEPTTWLTYSGSSLRASNSFSDFALLELNGSIIGQPTLALAGWNRASTIPTQTVTAIHHPLGDVKKISSDNEPLGTSGTNFWLIDQWDSGLVDHVSSGSPLFDASNRIIGQLNGGDNNAGCLGGGSVVDNNTYGRFDKSWTGSNSIGTNRRLDAWLGGSQPYPNTVNTIRSPYISGSGPICNASNKTFTLVNLIPGRTASWTASPANLLITASGSGTVANLRAASSSASGLITLTFTISAGSGCTSIPLVTTIWVGPPQMPTLSVNLSSLCQNSSGIATLIPNGQTNSVAWSFNGVITGTSNGLTGAYYYSNSQTGGGVVTAVAQNSCGNSASANRPISVHSCFAGGHSSGSHISPNPANSSVQIDFTGNEFAAMDIKQFAIKMYDNLGALVIEKSVSDVKETIETGSLKAGLYFVELITPNSRFREKLMIIR